MSFFLGFWAYLQNVSDNGCKSTSASFTTSLSYELLESRELLTGKPALFADVNIGGHSSSPSQFVEANGSVFFVASDGIHGWELWKTDSSTEGAVLVKDIAPGDEQYCAFVFCTTREKSSNPDYMVNIGGTLFFTAEDGKRGIELWKSDGTTSGTIRVKDIFPGERGSNPTMLTDIDGTLFFSADDGVHGRELWKSDGTSSGTIRVKDIHPGEKSSDPRWLTKSDGILFFSADDGVNGTELWRSDGTRSGTTKVADLLEGDGPVGPNSSNPAHLTAFQNEVFFIAKMENSDAELWHTDGTEEGTELVKEIRPGGFGAFPATKDPEFTAVGNTLFFLANDGLTGRELWKTDGTTEGTQLVIDIRNSNSDHAPENLTAVGDTLFFSVSDGVHGSEIWKSKGTVDSTVIVKDVNEGSGKADPQFLTNISELLYFVANDSIHGRELWRSDGSEEGTFLVADLGPGKNPVANKGPSELAFIKDELFFSANDGENGRELWSLNLSAPRVIKDVLVSGTTWTQSYVDHLSGSEQGNGGYSLLQSGEIYLPLLWNDINQIKIIFQHDVLIAENDLKLTGIEISDYAGEIGFVPGSFHYNRPATEAIWTLNEPIGTDQLALYLRDAVWQDRISTLQATSDDEQEEELLRFRFNVLPGDGTRDGQVDLRDIQLFRNSFLTSIYVPDQFGYDEFLDFNANGVIDIRDLQFLRTQLLTELPSGSPFLDHSTIFSELEDSGKSFDDWLEIPLLDDAEPTIFEVVSLACKRRGET